MIIGILFIILAIVILIVISLMMGVFGVPYVPTPSPVLQAIKNAHIIKENSYVLELGAGDARFLRLMHKLYDISGTGYEISPLFFALGWICVFMQRLLEKNKKNSIHLVYKSFFSADFTHADIIYCYLLPATLQKLVPYFNTMKSGSLLISYDFHIPQMNPSQTLMTTAGKPIYIYTHP